MTRDRRDEIVGILLLAFMAILVISLSSYEPNDIGFATSRPNLDVTNRAGVVGAYLAHILVFLTGRWGAWLVPLLTAVWAINRLWWKAPIQKVWVKAFGSLVLLVSCSSLFSLRGQVSERIARGGFVGFRYSELSLEYFGPVGTYLIIATLFLLSILLTTEFLFFPVLTRCARALKALVVRLKPVVVPRPKPLISGPSLRVKRFAQEKKEARPIQAIDAKVAEVVRPKVKEPPKEKSTVEPEPSPKPKVRPVPGGYRIPSLDLLKSPPPIEERMVADDLEANSRILEDTLRDFGVEVKVTEVSQGPAITTYELLPAPGVKVHRITSLSDDIALAMKAQSVRIIAPIPGKAAVGIEVPNSYTTLVYLREVLDSDEWKRSPSKLTLALGKDISGKPLVSNLGQMPHLLIAGTTGSGKTVCVNSLITSLLYQLTPDEIKFLMVDPKTVELACFNGLPHLLCPVVTEPEKVAGALAWAVEEMESRYKLLAKFGVRNIDLYNERLSSRDFEAEGGPPRHLPYILVIIDELADLMAVVQDKIENAITRLAQLSRAVGIHIVLATQRPSVDVITGVIKANFPARASFKVASKVDSRTVLDANGADKLLGKGDMLFMQPGTSKLIRAQGSLVTDEEIERVVSFAKSQREPEYNEAVLASQEKRTAFRELPKDELFDEAARMILETKHASVSMLQRRLGLGYTRAARILDMMEEEGIVGPYRGSKPREVLVAKEEYEETAKEESNQ